MRKIKKMIGNEYEEHWIETFSGRKMHYLNPTDDEIDIKDIAHALSLICRFGGHCKEFYSVAQHSLGVMELVPQEYKLEALLHDAAEAYISDLPRPIKNDLSQFKEIEQGIEETIFRKFNITNRNHGIIKMADNIMLATEARDIMANTTDWIELPKPLESKIESIPNAFVERLFLTIFEELMGVIDV